MIIANAKVCTDRTKYNELIRRYPLASEAFDISLREPPHGNKIHKGLLSLYRLGELGTLKGISAQGEVFNYESDIFDLSPVLHAALLGNEIRKELELASGYDIVADPSYEKFVEPPRNAKKTFTPEDIQRLNDEQKTKAAREKKHKPKYIPGFNADIRNLRELSQVMRDKELTENPNGSAIPTLRFVDPRFALIMLTSEGFGTNSVIEKERIGALNVIAQLLLDTNHEIQNSISFDDNLKAHIKVVRQIKQILKPLKVDTNMRIQRNAEVLDHMASTIIDEGIKVFERFNEIKENPNPELSN